jgi:predicted Zn-dependent protease
MRRLPLLFSLLLLAPGVQAETPVSPKIIERYKQMLAANPVEGTALDRLWKIYADQGQTGQLLDEYKGADSFGAQMILGHLLRRAGRLDEAAAAYQRAAVQDASSPLPALALARIESERAHPKEAAAWLEKAVPLLPAGDPRLPDTLLQLGSAWLEAGDTGKAAEAWEKTVALNPADLALRRKLADAYEKNYLPDRAIEHLTYVESHAAPTERPLILQQIARIQQGAGHRDAAIDALDKALALTGPGNWLRPELESQLIRLHQRYHRTEELETRWKKFAAGNPRDLGACLQLVELYERLGDLEQQRAWIEKLTQLAPKNLEYREKFARLLLQMDQVDQATAVYDELLKDQPANADFVFARAKLDVQRDAVPAAKQRITALLAARHNEESVRAKALEFYQQNHLTDFVEEHLVADAASNKEDALSALAAFYFGQHRETDARRVLQRMIRATDPPALQAAAHYHVAQILRGQNDFESAAAELALATKLQPENREFHMALGDLHAVHGDYALAQQDYEHAGRCSVSAAEKLEADQKLFESFNAASPPREAAPPRAFTFDTTGVETAPPEVSPALGQYLAALEKTAREKNTEADWLRLAQWKTWSRDNRGAMSATQHALALNPQSVAGYELMVRLQTTGGPTPGAVQNLAELARLDPANRTSYSRRAGQLELQAGHVAEALAIFERIAQENPGNLDALTDLALSQQRAEQWLDALATWKRVYAASPVSHRRDALSSLLRVLERLDQPQASAEFQLKAIEAEPNDRERFALFNELLTHCNRNNLLDWLRAQFEKRRRLHADDYFTEVALGRILKASGQIGAAFEILADASYAAPNQAEALPDLIREAEELHKLDTAIKLQEQLLRVVPQETPEGLQKLAQLQEKNFAIEAAEQTWNRLLGKFPRDVTALTHAIEFQMAWGTPARAVALLRKARSLDPTNIRALSTLATLDLEAGNKAEARDCLEQVVRNTTPEKPGDPVRFPALKLTEAGRLQSAYLATVSQRNGRPAPETMRALRSFWVDESSEKTAGESKADRDVRLNAIRQLAQIAGAGGPAGRATWVARWRQAPGPSEAIWALYYAGDGVATLDRVQSMMTTPEPPPGTVRKVAEEGPDPRWTQAFIWLGLQTRQFERLGAWFKDKHRTPSERDYLYIALGQAIDNGDLPSTPGMLPALFGEGTHLRLWQAAMLFAGRNRFAEAVELGRRVFDGMHTERATSGLEVAHWYLALGQATEARAVLRAIIDSDAEPLDSAMCTALREYYLLLPEPERPAFITAYLASRRAQPLHSALTGAILHGLAGNAPAAEADLDRLAGLRAMSGSQFEDTAISPGERQMHFVRDTGTQLEAQKLSDLAAYFWEKALADEAFIQLLGDPAVSIAREIRQRLCILRAATAPAVELPAWLDSYSRLSPADGLTPLADALSTMGAHARAIEIYRALWEREPSDTEATRNVIKACRAAGDDDTMEAVLRTVLSDGGVHMPDGARREFLLQFADTLEHQGDLEGARSALGSAVDSTPGDTRLLLRLAELHERAGHLDQAMATYQRLLVMEPGNLAARLALSVIYENQNRLNEALALFQSGAGPDFDARLALLQCKNNQPEAALTTLDRILPPQHVTPALNLAAAFAARHDRPHALATVQSALGRTTDARLSFPLQCRLIELLGPDDGAAVARRELRRLRRFADAGDNPGLLDNYLEFAAAQAARLNVRADFVAETQALWAHGSGPVPAGVAVLIAQLEDSAGDAMAATLDQLLARDDATDARLQVAATALEKAGRHEALARVQERIARLNPLNEQNIIALAHTLKALGRVADARVRLETLVLRAALDDEGLGTVAQAFAEIGDADRARTLFAQALHDDRFARNWGVLLPYARLQTSLGDFDGAKETLRAAFNVPANRGWEEIIAWLVAAHRLDRIDDELTGLHLSPPRLDEFRRALFAWFEKEAQPARALALAEAHPTLARPGYGPRLRKLIAGTLDFERGAKLLEQLANQADPAGEFSIEFARMLGDWAAAELADHHPQPALAHLRKAHEQRPEFFEIASRLSALQRERGDRQGSIETLESYLAVAKNPAEIEQARAQLAKLRGGG